MFNVLKDNPKKIYLIKRLWNTTLNKFDVIPENSLPIYTESKDYQVYEIEESELHKIELRLTKHYK